jgi:hypothetical protein
MCPAAGGDQAAGFRFRGILLRELGIAELVEAAAVYERVLRRRSRRLQGCARPQAGIERQEYAYPETFFASKA